MENWFITYGRFLNYPALELELGLPSGILVKAQKNFTILTPDMVSLIEGFFKAMEEELGQVQSTI